MTKENLIYGLAGTTMGIIMGFVIAINSNVSVAPNGSQAQSLTPIAGATLPEGHPPVDDFAAKEITRHEEILRTDPENQQSLVALANLEFDRRNYMQAAALYEKAIQRDPKNVNLITDLGSCFLQMNDFEKAISYYKQSLAIVPEHFQTLINLGIARASLKDKAGAIEAWQRVLAKHPDHADIAKVRQAIQEVQTME